MLPNSKWIERNGYWGLAKAMRRRPELFAHIEQDKRGQRTPREWVPIAEAMEKKHGKLASGSWLRRNGFTGLYEALRRYPKLFAHIKQDRRRRRAPREWTPLIEMLERKYGALPKPLWLRQNGHSGLECAMRRHPELLARPKQRVAA